MTSSDQPESPKIRQFFSDNDKHWFSDVVAGAGVGIASTRLAYWLYPKMQGLFGKKQDPEKVSVLMPTYQSGTFGLAYVKTF